MTTCTHTVSSNDLTDYMKASTFDRTRDPVSDEKAVCLPLVDRCDLGNDPSQYQGSLFQYHCPQGRPSHKLKYLLYVSFSYVGWQVCQIRDKTKHRISIFFLVFQDFQVFQDMTASTFCDPLKVQKNEPDLLIIKFLTVRS